MSSTTARPTIALVSPTAGPLLGRSGEGRFGGREVQTVRLASLLAKRYAVRVVLWGSRFARYQRGPHIEVWETTGPPPLPYLDRWHELRDAYANGWVAAARAVRPGALAHFGVRSIYRRAAWPRVSPAIDRDDVDAVIALGLHIEGADAMFTARRRGHAALLWLRSDEDISPVVRPRLGTRDPYGCPGHLQWAALHMADHVLVQNTTQQKQAQQLEVRGTTVIPNPPPDDTPTLPRPDGYPPGPFVLWVGRVDERNKRPSLALQIAAQTPDLPFVMVCNRMDRFPGHFEALKAKASANVTLLPGVPFAAIGHLFDEASLFLSTSAFEGFPNTFLQAARRGVPVVSTRVDPEHMLSDGRAGIVSGDDPLHASRALTRLLDDRKRRRSLGEAGKRWVTEHHAEEVVGPRLFDVVDAALAASRSRR